MANPQTEDGFTKIANELLDAMCQLRLSGTEYQVLMFIIRKTYGWNKKADWISGSQIVTATNLSKRTVFKALHGLVRRNVINRENGVTALQKDYSLWLGALQGSSALQGIVPYRAQGYALQGPKPMPYRAHTKDNKDTIQKTGEFPARIVTSFKNHPAIDAYAELTGKRPRKHSLQYDTIVETVTDNPAKVELWKEAIRAWLLCDNKPTNVAGILDWFRTGKRDNRSQQVHGSNQSVAGVPPELTPTEEAWRNYAISVKQRLAAEANGTGTV
jgi:phage replication O-like protein O